jgi:hypothetical protein
MLSDAAENTYIIFKVLYIGITALVDEATGYQYDRKDEPKILKYISEGIVP